MLPSFGRGLRHKVNKLEAGPALPNPPIRSSSVELPEIKARQKGKQKDADNS
jgi:hypothetical protein